MTPPEDLFTVFFFDTVCMNLSLNLLRGVHVFVIHGYSSFFFQSPCMQMAFAPGLKLNFYHFSFLEAFS